MTTHGRIPSFAGGCNLKTFKTGFIVTKSRVFLIKRKAVIGGKRNGIYTFSYQARQRLRRKLLVSGLRCPFVQFGLTLTVPGQVSEDFLIQFKALLNRFFKSVTREYPFHGLIYRIELQQRGMPHLHVVVYAPATDVMTSSGGSEAAEKIYQVSFEGYRTLWLRALSYWDGRDKIKGALKHSVHFDALSSASAIRYLCDHQTKRKQAQLGYVGKQWGVVGGRNLIEQAPFRDLTLSAKQTAVLLRAISRLRAGTVKAKGKPFGRIVSRNKRYRTGGVLYNDKSTMDRLLSWILSDFPITPKTWPTEGYGWDRLLA